MRGGFSATEWIGRYAVTRIAAPRADDTAGAEWRARWVRAEAQKAAVEIIHLCPLGMSISNAWLSSMTMTTMMNRLRGEFSDEDEREVLKAVQGLQRVPELYDLAVFTEVKVEGNPTVLASKRRWPGVDRAMVEGMLKSSLSQLGSVEDRRRALEDPLRAALVERMGRGWRFVRGQADGRWSDLLMGDDFGPLLNLEIRQRRNGLAVRLKESDAKIFGDWKGRGVSSLVVVPGCTQRYRSEVSEVGGEVIEWGRYLAPTEEAYSQL